VSPMHQKLDASRDIGFGHRRDHLDRLSV
jgi:hypothetical protein